MRTVFWGLVRTAPDVRDRARIDAAVESLKPLWERLDQHLSDQSFIAGDEFTMGDIPVGAMCHRYHALGIERPAIGSVSAWYERLKQRPAYQTHVMLPLS
jgi:glutathione S-transferase